MRFAAIVLALLAALFGAVPAAAAAPRGDPKVVLIVGPAGSATQRYRERAEAAAQIAERYTSNVVRVYSPNATWPAVRRALDGAAVVVYLGHGNGWPSRYRDSLYGVTQNGFGLNPVAGGDDYTHQYFGEDVVAAEVDLASNAIVLLHHLCYASGNTEPGLPEGTIAQARQRVVNYAAGFIRAGAGAVVAEGHMGPAWYVQQLFSTDRAIDDIWRASPNNHGNEFRFESSRSPGYVAAMDPDHGDSGFYRSIVYRGSIDGGSLAAAPEADPDVALEPAEPTLVGTGLVIGAPYLREPPVAGATTRVRFRYAARDSGVLDGLTVGVRWDPILVSDDSAAEEAAGSGAEGDSEGTGGEAADPEEASAATEGNGSSSEGGAAASEPGEASEPTQLVPPPAPEPPAPVLTWIQPERLGDVLEPVSAVVRATRVGVDLTMPQEPGRYRLVLTLHDAEGVAYDAATQAIVPAAIVDVTRPLAARYVAPASIVVEPGQAFELDVSVGNVGGRAWGQVGSDDQRNVEERAMAATLRAHWVALDPGAAGGTTVWTRLPAGLAPGAAHDAVLSMTAPERAGHYLLVLDVVLPGVGSLAAEGEQPAIVRVTVR